MKPSTEPDQSPFRSPGDRIEERERKREAVLVAAVRMFNSRGFHATSLDDVAVSLGVTRPVVYHYLGNKDQVLFECVRRGLEQLQDAARKASNHPGNGLARLRAFLIRYAEINMDDFGRRFAPLSRTLFGTARLPRPMFASPPLPLRGR